MKLCLTGAKDAYWIDLANGVRVQVKPIRSVGLAIARDASRRAIGELDDVDDEDDANGLGGAAFCARLAQWAIVAWDGIVDGDDQPLPVSHEAIDALLCNRDMYHAWQSAYVFPAVVPSAEKNASSPSLNGTSGADQDTAEPVA